MPISSGKKSNNAEQDVVLLYHEVTDYPERWKTTRHIDPNYSQAVDRFREQMLYLKTNSQHVVVDLRRLLTTESSGARVAITFDDGLCGNYYHARQILQSLDFPATFFVSVDDIGLPDFMDWDQIRELAQHGHSIQSHTLSHPMLSRCTEKQISGELVKSKQIIENQTGKPVTFLSLPFGDYNDTVLRIAREVGYQAVLTSRIEFKRSGQTSFCCGRIPIKSTYSLAKFTRLLNPESWDFRKEQKFDRLKSQVKSFIGLNNYRRIYRAFKHIELTS
ncbi:MAG TPA: polysaccharide deacetylase family protein [bacterium]|nr:polysaccharide deacetylase family protein [bacterium]HPG45183.1 polysaccharide deacetylase family protein [bacterium]HPM97425.1 polysaccharide deacetylase family protein [bacterium]